MTTDKLISVLEFYDSYLQQTWDAKVEESKSGKGRHHLRWMCFEMLTDMIPASRIEKAMRWLGFIQGVLFSDGYFTLAELRDHSREETM